MDQCSYWWLTHEFVCASHVTSVLLSVFIETQNEMFSQISKLLFSTQSKQTVTSNCQATSHKHIIKVWIPMTVCSGLAVLELSDSCGSAVEACVCVMTRVTANERQLFSPRVSPAGTGECDCAVCWSGFVLNGHSLWYYSLTLPLGLKPPCIFRSGELS